MGRWQSWRANLKARIAGAAHDTGRHPVLQRLNRAAVATQTAAATVLARRRARGPVNPGNLTVVVKTFERPDVLRRMLASVRKVFSGPIIVADDSRIPVILDDPDIQVLTLPFDTGIGAGRNALLAAVETPYVFMTDDDMVLLPDFDVTRPVSYLERNPGVDLVGGAVIHLPRMRRADYSATALYAERGEPRVRRGTVIDGLPVLYKVPNFYVARTDAVRAIGYDDRLKRVDHNDFFTSAYGRLVCVVDSKMVCLHAHSYFDAKYQAFRMDIAADMTWIAHKWGGGSGQHMSSTQNGPSALELATFHHAAVEVVARDLGLEVLHEGGPETDPVRVSLGAGAEALTSALGSLGWRSTHGRLAHDLWGELRITTASADAPTGVASEFAGITGRAAQAGVWPVPGTADPSSGDSMGLRRSPRAGWLETDHGVLAATLPMGPVLALDTPGDLVFTAFGTSPRDPERVVDEVLESFESPPDDADQQLHAFMQSLTEQGLLER